MQCGCACRCTRMPPCAPWSRRGCSFGQSSPGRCTWPPAPCRPRTSASTWNRRVDASASYSSGPWRQSSKGGGEKTLCASTNRRLSPSLALLLLAGFCGSTVISSVISPASSAEFEGPSSRSLILSIISTPRREAGWEPQRVIIDVINCTCWLESDHSRRIRR